MSHVPIFEIIKAAARLQGGRYWHRPHLAPNYYYLIIWKFIKMQFTSLEPLDCDALRPLVTTIAEDEEDGLISFCCPSSSRSLSLAALPPEELGDDDDDDVD